jgi:peptide-methionine (S)-S-oxide reductase
VLVGRDQRMDVPDEHHVLGTPLEGPWPDVYEVAIFGMGCFWGAEKQFWGLEGVHSTAVGYAGGYTPNPTYEEVCTGRTGHTEAVLVVYDPDAIGYGDLLEVFWETHDPTQGMRQGNDVGTQYRSAIYTTTDAQLAQAKASRDHYQERLRQSGYGEITTEVGEAPEFYYAEDHHQQYLSKHPFGYCDHGFCQVSYAG